MRQKTAKKILQETEAGYDSIAEKFSQTRKHFWRGLEFIKDYTHDNNNVLDFGCGNGQLLELIGDKDINYYGVDVSGKLIEIAVETHCNASLPDACKNIKFSKINPIQTTLAFDDNFFNTIYSIAVFHHFPSKKYREEVAQELFRITKPGGYVIITVWYLWPASLRQAVVSASRGGQKKYIKNIFKNWLNKILRKTDLDWNDCEISFTDNAGKKFFRFHRAFTKRELRNLFKQAGFEILQCNIPDGRNIVLVGEKEKAK